MNTQKGYSILELLVTVAIVGVIGSLALVQYQVVGQSTKLNGETISAIGLLRDMQNNALSPQKPTEFGNKQRICGYVMFKESSYSETLSYYAVGTTGSTTSTCNDTSTKCYTNPGTSCGSTEYQVEKVEELQLKNSEVKVTDQVFIETPFSSTKLGDGTITRVDIMLRNTTNTDITETISINKGGFITAQNVTP